MPRPKGWKPYKVGKDSVPGVTTPIGCWGGNDKVNSLVSWGQRLATHYEYVDGKLWHMPKYWMNERDARGKVGTLTHAFWSHHLDPKQEYPSEKEYTTEQWDEAWKLNTDLMLWLRNNPIAPLAIEEPLVSREHRYGGCPDVIDAHPKIIDVKTGFVNEFTCMLQCSSYDNLALENGLTTEHSEGIILQTYEGKVRVYRFAPVTLAKYFPTFLALLKTYKDEKQFNYMRKKNWRQ